MEGSVSVCVCMGGAMRVGEKDKGKSKGGRRGRGTQY